MFTKVKKISEGIFEGIFQRSQRSQKFLWSNFAFYLGARVGKCSVGNRIFLLFFGERIKHFFGKSFSPQGFGFFEISHIFDFLLVL